MSIINTTGLYLSLTGKKQTKSSAVISRTMFCPKCYENKRPQIGDLFGVYGSTNKKVWIYNIGNICHAKDYGFTPHFITVKAFEGDKVHLEVSCGMEGCGCEYPYENGWSIIIAERSYITISQNDYKALLLNPNLGYRLG